MSTTRLFYNNNAMTKLHHEDCRFANKSRPAREVTADEYRVLVHSGLVGYCCYQPIEPVTRYQWVNDG